MAAPPRGFGCSDLSALALQMRAERPELAVRFWLESGLLVVGLSLGGWPLAGRLALVGPG